MPTFEDYRKRFSGIIAPGVVETQDFIPGPQHKRTPSQSELMAQQTALKEMQAEPKSERDELIESLKPLEKIVLLELGKLVQDRQNISKKNGRVKKAALEIALRKHGYDDEQCAEIVKSMSVFWDLFKKLYPERVPKKSITEGKVKKPKKRIT